MAEAPILRDDNVFEDDIALGAPLPDALYDAIETRCAQEGHTVEGPITLYATPSSFKWYIHERGVAIAPESYHQAFDFDGTVEGVIETATEHYKKLRELGMPVVGHMFEPVAPDDEHFTTHPDFPSIIVAAKYPTADRPSDITDEEAALLQEASTEDQKARVRASEVHPGIVLSVNQAANEELGLTAKDLEEAVLDPVYAYYDWCDTTDQDYVLSGLNALHNYFYHGRSGVIGLQYVSSKMGKIHIPEAAGNLWSARQGYLELSDQIRGDRAVPLGYYFS